MSDERDILDAVLRVREEEARFFSNAAKPERERWVVSEFLRALGVEHLEKELESQSERGSIDVQFREARFQVKEIVDPAERRGDTIKESVQRARAARQLSDLARPAALRDTILYDLEHEIHLVASAKKYPSNDRSGLDLLVYVTRPRTGFNEPIGLAASRLADLGWRSICCLLGSRALLLVSTASSPGFLRVS